MLKKFSLIILSLVICLTLCFSVVACGNNNSYNDSALSKKIDDMQDLINSQNDKINSQNDKISGLESELNALKSGSSDIGLQAQINILKQELETLKSDSGIIESELDSLQTSLGAAESAISAIQNQVGNVSVATLKTNLESALSSISSLETKLGTVNIQTLKSDLDTAKASITSLQAQLGSVNVATLSSDMTKAKSDITILQNSLQSQIDSLKSRMTAAEAAITALQGQSGGGNANKVYSVGETVTVYNNGLKLFELTYVSKGAGTASNFRFKNFNVPESRIKYYLYVLPYDSINNEFIGVASNGYSSAINADIKLNTTLEFTHSTIVDHIYFGYFVDNTFLPYVIFKK